MRNLVPLYWNYKAHISRESSVTSQHLYQPEAWCGGLELFQWFSNQYILPEWENTSVNSEAVWFTELKENRAVVIDLGRRKWARTEMRCHIYVCIYIYAIAKAYRLINIIQMVFACRRELLWVENIFSIKLKILYLDMHMKYSHRKGCASLTDAEK